MDVELEGKDEYHTTDRMLEETLSQQRHTGHLQIEELEEDLEDALTSSPCSSRTSLATDEEERVEFSVGMG